MLRVEQVATDVDVHDVVVVGQWGIHQPRGHPGPGVVHQYIQAAQMVRGGGHRRGDRVRGGGVSRDEPGLRSQRLPGALTEARIAARDHHPRALAKEARGYGQAQAGGTTRDQRALPLQQSHGRSV